MEQLSILHDLHEYMDTVPFDKLGKATDIAVGALSFYVNKDQMKSIIEIIDKHLKKDLNPSL